MKKCIMAIDQGTTGTTVLLLDSNLQVVARKSREILPEYPQAGWVEHSLDAIWDGTLQTIKDVLDSVDSNSHAVSAIGITNQRETIGVWNRKSFVPQANAIVWQCRRTSEFCQSLKDKGLEDQVREKTGLVLDPYFSGSKIRWLLDNVDGVRSKADKGNVVFGTIDTFLLFRMTMGETFKTDATNASRTSLMNIKSVEWDDELLEMFQVPKKALPEIRSSSEIYGKTKGMRILPDGIPICGILGDQQAALFGQLCTEPGDAKITYGTGCFLLANTGKEPFFSKNSLLTTVAWQMNGETTYALEGSAFMGGATVQWLRDGLGIIKSSREVEALAMEAKSEEMGDLMLVPAMTGLGAPHWDANARGLICGITRGTNRSHIARATLEGIAHQNEGLLHAMSLDFGSELKSIKVDGGAAVNNFLMQYQCDLAGVPLSRPKVLETTALGAAIAAGLATNMWGSIQEVEQAWQLDRKFTPSMNSEEVHSRKEKWSKAITRVRL